MRAKILTLSVATMMFAAPASVLAIEVDEAPGTVVVPEGRSLSEGECENRRQACLKKEELGEEGEGNCKRYRELCR